MQKKKSHFPPWLRKKIDFSEGFNKTGALLAKYNLNTVCESANCPNKFECYNNLTSTVMILGKNCTRACLFCRVDKSGLPEAVEQDEAARTALFVKECALKYVVITSVTRDDLADGGARHFYNCALQVTKINPGTTVELLIPDFKGDWGSLKVVCACPARVIGHNIETVPRLYKTARKGACYSRSLDCLVKIKNFSLNKITKSSIILGLGETNDEVIQTLKDIARTGCDIVVIGQYLKAGFEQMDVQRFVTPDEFDFFKSKALEFGIKKVYSGPWFRSSYKAEEMAEDLCKSS